MKKYKTGQPGTGQLIRVSNYARNNNIGLTEAYRRIKDGRVKSEKIDGMIFILIDNE